MLQYLSSLLTAYNGPLGSVSNQDIWGALGLMGKGMLGILIVMALIWVVIFILNKTTGRKGPKDGGDQ